MSKFIAIAAAAAGLALAGSAQASTTVFYEGFDGYAAVDRGATASTQSTVTNNSFTTSYGYRSGAQSTGTNSMYDEGTWTINTNPVNTHNLWVDLGADNDQTNDNNNMLILNGRMNTPRVDWLSNAFTVSAGTFNYSVDIMNVCCNSNHGGTTPSTLWFQYTADNGQSYNIVSGPIVTLMNPGQFYTQSGSFTLASGGSLQIGLFDTSGVADGNDFAVDNITLTSAAPEPMSWALMIGGFGLAGAMLRRQRFTLAA